MILNPDILLTLKFGPELFIDSKRIALLKAIHQTGSLSQAARSIAMSYKAAWDAINNINQLAQTPFVITLTGGKGGGGAVLSEYAVRFIELYGQLTTIQNHTFDILKNEAIPLNDVLQVAAKVSLQSSARNQLYGTITAINVNNIAGFVTVLLQDKQTIITVYITHSSIKRLQLATGKAVILLIKAPQIELVAQNEHNHYLTYVDSIIQSEYWCELTLSLVSGIKIYVSRPIDEAIELNIRPAEPLNIYINPENIIIATIA